MAAQEHSESGSTTKALIFDCFGVLYVGSLEMLHDITPKEKWEELSDLNIGSDYGYISVDEYLDTLVTLTGLDRHSLLAMREAVHVRNEPVVEYARELHKTYKIAMLSNVGPDLIERLFTEREQEELFDTIVLSSKEGLVKPHPGIFQLTADRLGVAPGECIMIDDLSRNVVGADAAGMRGIQFTSLDNLKTDLARIL